VNNNYRFKLGLKEEFINIPIKIDFDNLGRQEAVEEFERQTIEKVINPINDFETTRFAHAPWDTNQDKTEINYQFNFFDPTGSVLTATQSSWLDDYQYATFTDDEIYFFANSFKGSFFKLDLYDTNSPQNQRALLSVILPTQQGLKEPGTIGTGQTPVEVKKPKFILDYVGPDKEGFFIYWLKEQSFLSKSHFYMSCKFFNAKKGTFVRMMNEPQSVFNGVNKFNFDKGQYFFYKVVIDYNTYEYKVYKEIPVINQTPSLVRVGDNLTPIIWYEYINEQ